MEHFYEKIQGWFDFQELYLNAVENAPNNSKFVEIGAWIGKSTAFLAVEIYNSKKNIELNVIDIWDRKRMWFGKGDEGYDPYFETHHHESILPLFKQKLSPIIDLIDIKCYQESSHTAHQHFENDSLYFVQIDGSHIYEDVLKDLEFWYPKIKKNGIFAGHDFKLNDEFRAADNEVYKAVCDFVKKYNLKLSFTCDSTWIINL